MCYNAELQLIISRRFEETVLAGSEDRTLHRRIPPARSGLVSSDRDGVRAARLSVHGRHAGLEVNDGRRE